MTAGPRWRLAEARHGSLPVLLLALTVVTGVIDAVSLLALGRVFVANMTGNVVLMGFGIAGVPEFSLVTSLVALAAFLIGAAAGGLLVDRIDQRGARLRTAVLIEWVLLAACLVMVLLQPPVMGSLSTRAAVAVAALAMGVQIAAARSMAVPDLNTSVVSISMTALAADHTHSPRETVLRRTFAVLSLLVGAAAGAVLVRAEGGVVAALGLILVLLAGVGVVAHTLQRRGPDWEG